jgi:putative transposase
MPTALSGHVLSSVAQPTRHEWAGPTALGRMVAVASRPVTPSGSVFMTGKRKTCRRHNEPGHAHSLTFSCFCQRPFLSKDRARLWLVEAIDRARQIHAFDLWAYVIMPEHVHLLIWPHDAQYSVSRILTSLKRPVTLKALSHVRSSAPAFLSRMEDRQPGGQRHYRFWQRGGGYDRNLTEPENGVGRD